MLRPYPTLDECYQLYIKVFINDAVEDYCRRCKHWERCKPIYNWNGHLAAIDHSGYEFEEADWDESGDDGGCFEEA